MSALRLAVAAVMLAAIGAVVWWEAEERVSPGPLHPLHAEVPELRSDGCARCHGAGGGVAAAGCTDCHRAVGEQLARGEGLHGTADGPERCVRCHPEHHGAAAALLDDAAFAAVGVPERDAYDHRHAGEFALVGAHEGLSCERCHPHADARRVPAGETRFLGASQACTSCHEDPHDGSFGADCAQCHGQTEPFAAAPRFGHERFALTGGHGGVSCGSCHEDGTAHSLDRATREPPAAVRACADCHDDVHAAGEALPLGASSDCARCHDPALAAFARSFDVAAHRAAGVELPGAHATADCRSCHRGPQVPAMSRCADCHAGSQHRPAFLAATATDDGCARCHDPAGEGFGGPAARERAAPLHAATGFPLGVPHDRAQCAGCHEGTTTPGPAAAVRAPESCAACHADPHAGQFGPRGDDCLSCHVAERFAPPAFALAAHEQTRYPLRGAHRAVACAGCHEVRDGVRRFAGVATDCASCHRDPHGGRFAAPAEVDGRRGCVRCHDERTFRPATAGFAHDAFTGWPLRGAHAAAACTACHGRAEPTAERPISLAPAPTACAACHDDPHAGQFARLDAGGRNAGGTDCARCHAAEEAGFALVGFAHDAFPLDERHHELACVACHRPVATPAGAVVRYRPLGTTCAACHGPRGGRR